jgi:hypothetical protein
MDINHSFHVRSLPQRDGLFRILICSQTKSMVVYAR